MYLTDTSAMLSPFDRAADPSCSLVLSDLANSENTAFISDQCHPLYPPRNPLGPSSILDVGEQALLN